MKIQKNMMENFSLGICQVYATYMKKIKEQIYTNYVDLIKFFKCNNLDLIIYMLIIFPNQNHNQNINIYLSFLCFYT